MEIRRPVSSSCSDEEVDDNQPEGSPKESPSGAAPTSAFSIFLGEFKSKYGQKFPCLSDKEITDVGESFSASLAMSNTRTTQFRDREAV